MLVARGHEVRLLAVEHLSSLRPLAPSVSGRLTVSEAGVEAAKGFAREFGPDVIFQHGISLPDLESFLLDQAPGVAYVHNYYGSCISGSKRLQRGTDHPCDRTFGPLCLLHYLPDGCGGRNPVTGVKLYALQMRRKKLLGRCSRILVGSRHMEREYLKYPETSRQLRVVPLFIAPLATEPKPKGAAHDTLLFLGRLSEWKGVSHLIRALPLASAALQRPLELMIAGDGSQRAVLEALAQTTRSRVTFLGSVDPEQRRALFSRVDVLAVPSTWPEPFGLVGLEAAQFSVPSVAYSVGGIPDWLEPGVSGELAPGNPPTVEGLAEALTRALQDPNHLRALGTAARRGVDRFLPERHMELLEAALKEAAG